MTTRKKVVVSEQFRKDWNVLTGKEHAENDEYFLSHSREQRLKEVESKRQEILGDDRGRCIFSTWLKLPEQDDYAGWKPMGKIFFTISLSRKYDDVYYLYMLDTYDNRALDVAREMAEEELEPTCPKMPYKMSDDLDEWLEMIHAPTPEMQEYHECHDAWSDEVEKRAAEIARMGIEITPYFHLNKDSSAGIEVTGVVDVKEFTADGIIEAINKFLELGEVEWKGEPLIHVVSEDYLNPVFVKGPEYDDDDEEGDD